MSYGDFGPAHPEVTKLTGSKTYNVQLALSLGEDIHQHGVVNSDGTSLTVRGILGVATLVKITKEEVAEVLADRDPLDAPPGPYKVQTENKIYSIILSIK